MVKSTVTYGAEIWKLQKNLYTKLMSLEMDFLKRSARCSGLEKFKNVREKMNIKNSVLGYMRYIQLNWYGHVQRMEE